MKKIVSLLLLVFMGISCSPKIKSALSDTSYAPLDLNEPIYIIEVGADLPKNSAYVGDLKIGDSGFTTDCGYEVVINNAKSTAQKAGANFVQLLEVKKPNLGSTCYRIKAKLYRNRDAQAIADYDTKEKAKNKSRLPANADYALVHFYRPKQLAGAMIGYKIRMDNDSIIGRVRNGEKFAFKTSNFGNHTFWGITEARDSVKINVQKGEEYFVRCAITIGIAVGRPELNLTPNKIGAEEFEAMK